MLHTCFDAPILFVRTISAMLARRNAWPAREISTVGFDALMNSVINTTQRRVAVMYGPHVRSITRAHMAHLVAVVHALTDRKVREEGDPLRFDRTRVAGDAVLHMLGAHAP